MPSRMPSRSGEASVVPIRRVNSSENCVCSHSDERSRNGSRPCPTGVGSGHCRGVQSYGPRSPPPESRRLNSTLRSCGLVENPQRDQRTPCYIESTRLCETRENRLPASASRRAGGSQPLVADELTAVYKRRGLTCVPFVPMRLHRQPGRRMDPHAARQASHQITLARPAGARPRSELGRQTSCKARGRSHTESDPVPSHEQAEL